jgi:nitroimidazol reductase NimA-like FMN-containing flavoprotein (pyridoxamine 5'-phosphate oxidase superfamily)
MMIHEMSREECHRVLARATLARLGCARENQPYVVPVYLAFLEQAKCFYGFTTPGQKVEWMRSNPLVCVEIDEIVSHDQWVSVIAFGRYEELPETPASEGASVRAPERPRPGGETMPPWSADSQHRACDNACDNQRELAWQVLQTNPAWAEPGHIAWAARGHRNTAEPFISVFYRIRIDRVTGHEATRDAKKAISSTVSATPPARRWVLLLRTLTRVFTGKSKAAGSSY